MVRKKRNGDGYFVETIELPPDNNGKRRRKYIRSKTAAGLKEKLQAAYAKLEAGDLPIKARGGWTVEMCVNVWMERAIAQGEHAAGTIATYKGNNKKYLLPGLGGIDLSDLTARQCQRFVDKLPCKPNTARVIIAPLVNALDDAVRDDLIKRNVARLVRFKENVPADLYKLSPEELQAFLAAVAGDRYEALYWLAMLGPRCGELLGLRTEDVNLEAGTLAICYGSQRIEQADGSSKVQHIPTKSEAGERTLYLPDQWIEIVRLQLAILAIERRSRNWKEHGLLFPTRIGTFTERTNLQSQSFKPALRRAGLPADKIRFHDLRHAAASMLIALKYDARTVADILGHASPDFTLRQYAYAFESVKQKATADVGALLGDMITIPSKVHNGSE